MHVHIQSNFRRPDDGWFEKNLMQTVRRDLHRYDARIRNVDVLILEDDRSPDQKWCVVEARLPGRESIAVRAHAPTYERAVHAGALKIEQVIHDAYARQAETIDWTPEDGQP